MLYFPKFFALDMLITKKILITCSIIAIIFFAIFDLKSYYTNIKIFESEYHAYSVIHPIIYDDVNETVHVLTFATQGGPWEISISVSTTTATTTTSFLHDAHIHFLGWVQTPSCIFALYMQDVVVDSDGDKKIYEQKKKVSMVENGNVYTIEPRDNTNSYFLEIVKSFSVKNNSICRIRS